MTAKEHIAGVILAGGSGRRMFPGHALGGDKAMAPLAGQPLIQHVAAVLRPQVRHLVINANGEATRFGGLADAVVPDARADEGPLAGILAAMDWALHRARSVHAVVSVSTDTPFLPENLVLRLMQAAPDQTRPSIATSGDRLHPVIGYWPLHLRGAIAAALIEGRRSVEKFAAQHAAIAVPFSLRTIGTRTVDPFFNTNTPEDLASAEILMSEIEGEMRPWPRR